ncbi:MAG TPA: galactitol-1-phosphate 5-dehydrogenase [Mariniphaga anaerophila]|uniref:Galactitol-1-phosphate 5-dehydrogenase n=1 Tax=Mariniphaga anaerophila TaxID=1484053 RepID=A0A831LQK0_9BACT|nr:galactitol-1-phosphate 5-dehydrogenase [Mariniphaga anaerophila]
MKALVLEEYNKLTYKEVAKPAPAPNEVLIEVKAAGICGSDVHGMDGSTGRRIPPVIMGHEAAGVIVSSGEKVLNWKPGDRVTFDSTIYRLDDWFTRKGLYNLSDDRMVLGVSCAEFKKDGAFAEYVTVPEHILYKLPGNVSFEHAAMVEPVAVALHAINLTDISLNDTVVVGGAGMIALFVIQLLKLHGCGQIIAFDIDQDRLELAKKLGATHVFHAEKANVAEDVKKLTQGRGADIGFEVVGISPVIKSVIESVRKGGQVTLVGNVSPVVDLPLQQVVTRQLRLQGSCAICGEYEQVLDLISKGKIQIDPLLSTVAPLEDGAAWFNRLYNREKGLMKVILKP